MSSIPPVEASEPEPLGAFADALERGAGLLVVARLKQRGKPGHWLFALLDEIEQSTECVFRFERADLSHARKLSWIKPACKPRPSQSRFGRHPVLHSNSRRREAWRIAGTSIALEFKR
jgi:hypothetical protein